MTDILPIYKMTTRLTCVRYTDAMSIDHSSYNDLELGDKYRTVGSNGRALGASKPGDRVIIVANRGPTKYFTIGVIQEPVHDCRVWANAGGHVWNNNFAYVPLIGLQEITPAVTSARDTIAAKHCLNATNLFHSRFCSAKLNQLVDDLLVALAK